MQSLREINDLKATGEQPAPTMRTIMLYCCVIQTIYLVRPVSMSTLIYHRDTGPEITCEYDGGHIEAT